MTSIEKKIRKAVETYLRVHRIPREASLLVGFSGGPDSVALLSILLGIKRTGPVIAAYLNHGIRPAEELGLEIARIREYTDSRGVPLEIGSIAPARIDREVRECGLSVEDVARRHRYTFLEKAAEKWGCDYIVLGHNRDDHIETLITRFLQGSGVAGLRGIPDKRGKIIRPLIKVSKKEILEYLAIQEQEYSIDSTNADITYLRNRVRHEILPRIKEVFPGYEKALWTFSEKMSYTEDFIKREADERLTWEVTEKGYRIAESTFLLAHPILRLTSLYNLYNLHESVTGRERLPYGALRPAMNWEGGPDGNILQWQDYRLSRRNGYIFWEEDIVFEEKKQYLITVDSDIDIVVERQSFRVRLCDDESERDGVNIRAAAPPLVIRSKRDGDRLLLAGGRTELNKLFSEWKVRSEHRRMIPVVEDLKGIVAVLGLHLGYKNRYRVRDARNEDEMIYRINIEVLANR